MKQPYSFKTWHALISMLFVLLCCLPETVAAQVSFSDDFNYPSGNLHEQGGWVRYGKNAEDPIQVLDKQLVYAGYNDDAPAKCVKIGSANQGEDLMVKFTDNADGVKSGNLYFSALINVEAQPKGNVYVMSFVPRTKASEIAEGIAPTELGRLYIGESTNADEVKVGIERGASNPVFATAPLKLNQTYLVVLRYEINAANPRQDNIYLYVNPTDFSQEPKLDKASAVIDGVNKTGSGLGSYGQQGLELRQGTTSSVTSPEMYVASVRVSDTYAGLFGASAVDTTPKLSVSKKTFVLGEVYSGDVHEETVKVTGENLKGDISVESSSEAVSVEPASISADDAMSADGAELKIKVTYTDGEQHAVLTLKSEGADDVQIKLSWTGYSIPENANPTGYIQQLVRVKNLKFKDVAEGAVFAEGMTQPVVTDGTEEAKVRIFKGTTLIGKNIPTANITLTGLFTSSKTLIIGPRGIEDIVEQQPAGDPAITITPEKIEQTAGKLGQTVEVATLHVSTQNMTQPTFFELAGKNTDQFALSQTKIEKGSAETDIVITYTPTEVAVHRAYVLVTCPSIEDYDKSIAFSAYAIDEQNPPTITLNPQKLEQFTAKINEKSEQTIEVTTANMPDYTYVKLKDPGVFLLNNTMLIRNMTNTLKVTFQPKKEGTYSTSIVFSALGMDDVEVAIEGVATGETPDEPKEGVDLVLSEENARSVLDEKFDNIERNKPLDIEGWTNSALKGTRAWWGFSFLDYDAESPNEKVAKVTPYDSKMETGTGTPAQMMLVTPPLDFKNSTTKVFTFKVRGDYLQDNQPDLLELCYVDIADGSLYVQPLAECKMPCTKDESGKWFPYSIDLTGQQLADVFFMAFRFTSTRGCDNTATYYIDDVTYGLETTAIKTVGTTEKARLTVYNLAGSKVAEKSGSSIADALHGLPRGMYIVKAVSADGVSTSKVQVK